jgi:threonine dehydratase
MKKLIIGALLATAFAVPAYAALKKQCGAWKGKRVACVLTGGNASMEMLSRALGV